MTLKRRFQRRRGGSGRAKTTWSQYALTFNLSATGTTVFADLTPPPLLIAGETFGHGSATVKRAIMSFNLAQEAAVTNQFQQMGLGIYVETTQGVVDLSIRDALSGSENDWYYWTARGTFMDTSATQGLHNWEVDIRLMRRLREGYRLVVIAQANPTNSQNLEVTAGMRLLWTITG